MKDMDITVIIDKDKLPEDLKEKLKDLEERVKQLEGKPLAELRKNESNLFEVQQGTVVGNIYKDNLLK